jgi:hypothetical protein
VVSGAFGRKSIAEIVTDTEEIKNKPIHGDDDGGSTYL